MADDHVIVSNTRALVPIVPVVQEPMYTDDDDANTRSLDSEESMSTPEHESGGEAEVASEVASASSPWRDWRPILHDSESNQVVLYNPTSHALSITPIQRRLPGGQPGQPIQGIQRNCPCCKQPLPPGFEFEEDARQRFEEYDDHEYEYEGARRMGGGGGIAPNYFQLLAIANESSDHDFSASASSSSGASSAPPSPSPSSSPSPITSPRLTSASLHPSSDSEATPIGITGNEDGNAQSTSISSAFPPGTMAEGYFDTFFKEETRLGMGAAGTVYLVQHMLDNNPLGHFAVKKIAVGESHEYLLNILKEITFLERLRHENVISYHHAWLESCQFSQFGPRVPTLHVLMQWAEAGSLDDFIDARLGREPRHAYLPHPASFRKTPSHLSPEPSSNSLNHSTPMNADTNTKGEMNGDENDEADADPNSRAARVKAFRAFQRASPEEKAKIRARAHAQQHPQSNRGAGATPTSQWTPVHLLSPSEIRSIFGDVVEGLNFLHGRGVLHLDLKPGNVLLTWDADSYGGGGLGGEIRECPRAMLSDFGTSRDMISSSSGLRTGNTGTLEYTAPETLPIPVPVSSPFSYAKEANARFRWAAEGEPLSEPQPPLRPHAQGAPGTQGLLRPIDSKADMWSLGMILHKMVFFRLPWRYSGDGMGMDVGGGVGGVGILTATQPIHSVDSDLPADNIPPRPPISPVSPISKSLPESQKMDLLEREIRSYTGFRGSSILVSQLDARRLPGRTVVELLEGLLFVEGIEEAGASGRGRDKGFGLNGSDAGKGRERKGAGRQRRERMRCKHVRSVLTGWITDDLRPTALDTGIREGEVRSLSDEDHDEYEYQSNVRRRRRRRRNTIGVDNDTLSPVARVNAGTGSLVPIYRSRPHSGPRSLSRTRSRTRSPPSLSLKRRISGETDSVTIATADVTTSTDAYTGSLVPIYTPRASSIHAHHPGSRYHPNSSSPLHSPTQTEPISTTVIQSRPRSSQRARFSSPSPPSPPSSSSSVHLRSGSRSHSRSRSSGQGPYGSPADTYNEFNRSDDTVVYHDARADMDVDSEVNLELGSEMDSEAEADRETTEAALGAHGVGMDSSSTSVVSVRRSGSGDKWNSAGRESEPSTRGKQARALLALPAPPLPHFPPVSSFESQSKLHAAYRRIGDAVGPKTTEARTVNRKVAIRTVKSVILVLKIFNLATLCHHGGGVAAELLVFEGVGGGGRSVSMIIVVLAVMDTWFDGLWVSVVFGVLHIVIVRLGARIVC